MTNPSFGLTPTLYALEKRIEGWRENPYICPAGYPTIGYGHRIPDPPGLAHPPITLAQGIDWLGSDLRFKRDAVLKLSPGLADEPEARLAAIVDFAFNVGEGRYATSTLRQRVDAKDWVLAAKEMKRWIYARDPKSLKKVVLNSLVNRRTITASWLETGHD